MAVSIPPNVGPPPCRIMNETWGRTVKPSHRRIKILPILALVTCLLPGVALAKCAEPNVRGANEYLSASGQFDAQLMDRAILSAANYQRCLKGLPALRPVSALIPPAKDHSNWMASKKRLSHTSTVAGRRTLKDRVFSTGLPARAASENLAQLALFDLTPRFRVIDGKSCRFASPDGKRLTPHSYASFADKVVTLWMNSPGHRRNLLSRKTTHMASAASLRENRTTCGTVYVTQIFVG